MKKILFSICFFSILALGAQAQSQKSCSKPCTKSAAASAACQTKAPSVASAHCGTSNSAAAAKLASTDPTIETRTDPATGNVSYVRKETSAHSGTVTFVDVNYDASTNTFINVAPSKVSGTGTGCGSKATAGKSCCAGKAASVKSAEKVKS